MGGPGHLCSTVKSGYKDYGELMKLSELFTSTNIVLGLEGAEKSVLLESVILFFNRIGDDPVTAFATTSCFPLQVYDMEAILFPTHLPNDLFIFREEAIIVFATPIPITPWSRVFRRFQFAELQPGELLNLQMAARHHRFIADFCEHDCFGIDRQ